MWLFESAVLVWLPFLLQSVIVNGDRNGRGDSKGLRRFHADNFTFADHLSVDFVSAANPGKLQSEIQSRSWLKTIVGPE